LCADPELGTSGATAHLPNFCPTLYVGSKLKSLHCKWLMCHVGGPSVSGTTKIDKPNQSVTQLIWADELIRRFWDGVGCAHLDDLSVGRFGRIEATISDSDRRR